MSNDKDTVLKYRIKENSIDDIDGGKTPFTVEAGVPSHSFYVDDGGRIGLGTSTPVVEIHSKNAVYNGFC